MDFGLVASQTSYSTKSELNTTVFDTVTLRWMQSNAGTFNVKFGLEEVVLGWMQL